MPSPVCELAIAEAIRYGNAILKFISRNDVDATGAHQYGFLLPKPVWNMYTEHPPIKTVNSTKLVSVLWQDGRTTNSCIHWYGTKSRSEYRLTRFQKDFPFRTFDNVGDLLVFIRKDGHHFSAYVLDQDEDIEEIKAVLGIAITKTWGAFQAGSQPTIEGETENECLNKRFRKFVADLDSFPSGRIFSNATLEALNDCVEGFGILPLDEILVRSIDAEYQLFRLAERQICQPQITRLFKSVDDFLETASSIMNRRKSRAGRSLENHFEYLLKKAGLPYETRSSTIEGSPDVVIPSQAAYHDSNYPVEKLYIVGIKTTCKDRWRQVLNEGGRVHHKHIVTMQPGISDKQLSQMHKAWVSLIVPQPLHNLYPRNHEINLLTIEEFINSVKAQLARDG
jgi:type II restriction enzyme